MEREKSEESKKLLMSLLTLTNMVITVEVTFTTFTKSSIDSIIYWPTKKNLIIYL